MDTIHIFYINNYYFPVCLIRKQFRFILYIILLQARVQNLIHAFLTKEYLLFRNIYTYLLFTYERLKLQALQTKSNFN